ncbi:hypothetical protein L5515_009623 [Caenorhabditis briggsae]|nr:hypothetical protein L5515_009623 [Caenorhabditis briggsae]
MQAPQFFDQPAMPSQMSFGYQQHQQHQQQHYQDQTVMVAHPLPPMPPGLQPSYQQLQPNPSTMVHYPMPQLGQMPSGYQQVQTRPYDRGLGLSTKRRGILGQFQLRE